MHLVDFCLIQAYSIQPLLIPHIFPALRHLVYLCHQRWWSYRNIRFIRHVPILFLASLRDELVPPSHMAKLYKAAETSGPKVWCEFKNGTHNDTCMQVWIHAGRLHTWDDGSKQPLNLIGRILWSNWGIYTRSRVGSRLIVCSSSSSSSEATFVSFFHRVPFPS